jgi:dihydropteridine reductase
MKFKFKRNGFLLLTGAEGALKGTPQMIAYGMAKSSVHHLVSSLASPKSGLPLNSTTVAILPTVIDTPSNRSSMPNANFQNWTSMDELAEQIAIWSEGLKRPTNGKLVKIDTKEGVTSYTEL